MNKFLTRIVHSTISRKGAIDVWHKQGIEMGAKDKGAQKIWTDFEPNYYAAYLTDPDGWQIEAVFRTTQ